MRKQLKPLLTRPRDFDAFWDKTRAELAAVPAAPELQPVGAERADDVVVEAVSFASLGGARIRGYFARPSTGPGGPVVVHCHGYGSVCTVQLGWVRAGFTVLGFDVRGFGHSRDAVPNLSKWGFVLTGIGAPETCALRGAICDFVRAAEVARALAGDADAHTVLYGRSFGGALALMAEAVRPTADLLAIGVPTFGWTEGRHFFVKAGSGHEVNTYLEARPDHAEDVMFVFRYFDCINHAGRVRCPTLLGVGLEDPVVPAKTAFAIANHLGGPVELMEFPVSHTDRPEEKLWDRFEERWEGLARDGVPEDFGGTEDAEVVEGDDPTETATRARG